MEKQRAYELTLGGEEGAFGVALREALRGCAHDRVLDLVYAAAPNARCMGPLLYLGVDISATGALVASLWHSVCATSVEREWYEALGVTDPMTVLSMRAQGIGVAYLMEVYTKVLEDAVGNALDNENDSNYEGVADFVAGCRKDDPMRQPAWAEGIRLEGGWGGMYPTHSVYEEDLGPWQDALEHWDRDALLGYVWCQLDSAYYSLKEGGGYEDERWWWSEGFSKHARQIHKGLSDEWCLAVLHLLFPEDFGDLAAKNPAWWGGGV